ncbi:hypothetical protein NDN08_006210 [Rhodosorus marinus]|uniref:Transcription factor n=1 Tax=Rhodosorus marinus TaxID=101924 RepID=A0AAV8UK46_9RHOD|nr:hypothetical protein NDN08_006210 [Rhodosorus marinus]
MTESGVLRGRVRTGPKMDVKLAKHGVEKQNKGLRHFAIRVCSKVREKCATSHTELADDLVKENFEGKEDGDFNERSTKANRGLDEKNIRRRVYDALNVLMAMNIVEKNKKQILWRGLPAMEDEESVKNLQAQIALKREAVDKKRARVAELIAQRKALTRLSSRNKEIATDQSLRIEIPFIVVRTGPSTGIDLEVETGGEAVCFAFDDKFHIEDDQSIMRQLGFFDESEQRPEQQTGFKNEAVLFDLAPAQNFLSWRTPEVFASPNSKNLHSLYAALQSPEVTGIDTNM